MRRALAFLLASLVATLAIAACGGGGSGSPAASPGASAAASPSADAGGGGTSPEPGASVAASAAASAAGGGGAGSACDLITAEELAAAVGVASATIEPSVGEPSYCTYRDPDGEPIASTVLSRSNAQSTFQTFASAEDAVEIPGLGDQAIFSESWLNSLYVLKGDSMFNINAGSPAIELEARIELSKKLAAIAVGRM